MSALYDAVQSGSHTADHRMRGPSSGRRSMTPSLQQMLPTNLRTAEEVVPIR
jgi:hypothetical protein